eukprot:13888489-Alexandrium_andersonii.AAC.1
MSASLVGSEMCIRDRGKLARTTESEHMPTVAAAAFVNKSTTAPGRRGASVSYTHLTLPTICSV